MDLLLIRHAQTHSNVARALDTALPGADLTDLGERQVAELARLLDGEKIDAVWCSPTLRTRRTAAGLAEQRGLEPEVRDGLVEISAGDWEMSTADEHGAAYREAIVAAMDGGDGPLVPGRGDPGGGAGTVRRGGRRGPLVWPRQGRAGQPRRRAPGLVRHAGRATCRSSWSATDRSATQG